VLAGADIVLREPRLVDGPALAALLHTGATWRFTASPPETPADLERFIIWVQAERGSGHQICYTIADGDRPIAALFLARRVGSDFRTADVGLIACGDALRGDLVVSGVEAAIDFLVRHVGVHRIEMRTVTDRESDIVRRAGGVLDGVLRQAWQISDRAVDLQLWSVLDKDWRVSHREARYVCQPALVGPPESCGADPDAGSRPAAGPEWIRALPVLGTGTVTLREIELSDAAGLFESLPRADIEVCIDPPPTTVAMFERFVEWARRQRQAGRGACFGIVSPASDAPAGLVQVRQVDPRFIVAAFGMVVAPGFRGTGLAAQVARLVLAFVFDTVGARRLEARTCSINLPAVGAMQKLGAAAEAHLRAAFRRGTEYVDDDLWALLAEDWRRSRRLV
jgi:RimJ/RimL family protein N-acetyltransferase